MTFPKYKDIQIPLLEELLSHGGEAEPSALYERLAERFALTPEERAESVASDPRGRNKWNNMVCWARNDLRKAGELDGEEYGVWRITEKGRQRLQTERPMTLNSIDTSRRIAEIIDVLKEIKARSPRSLDEVRENRIVATKSVAQRQNISEESVRDKCWRQLNLKTIEEFDVLTNDWLVNGSSALEEKLTEHVSLRNREADIELIQQFFGNGQRTRRLSWWWVNQGQSYNEERKGNFIWAPQKGKDGQEIFHHLNVSRVKTGDVIFHYADGNIVSVSIAEEDAVSAPRPAELPTELWDKDGYMVKVRYFDLPQVVSREAIPLKIRVALGNERKTPFNKTGNVNQGYLFALPEPFAGELIRQFPQLLPPGIRAPGVMSTETKSPEESLKDFIDAIESLRVDKENGIPRLYKPAVLLAIVDALDTSELRENHIEFDWLVPQFVQTLAQFGKTGGEKQTAAAFFHLQNEPFWRLKLKQYGQPPLRGEPGQIRNQVENAYFLQPYWDLLLDSEYRDKIRKAIIDYWFIPSNMFMTTRQPFDYAKSTAQLIASIEQTGFTFEPWQVACYVTAMRTKPFLILAGVSGSGKSQLPQLIARATGSNCELIPVRPDWTDSSDILGYVRLQGRLQPGPLLTMAAKASRLPDEQFVCIVDEMNLARVEHYFAEILSRIEECRSEEGTSSRLLSLSLADEDKEWEEIPLSSNLALVGTVNMDESTHGFSRKVLDRAFTLEFSEIDLTNWENPPNTEASKVFWPAYAWQPRATRPASLDALSENDRKQVTDVIKTLVDINKLLTQAQLQLAYRSRDEIVLFVLHANDLLDSFVTRNGQKVAPLDLAIQMKVLPRIAGGSGSIRKLVLQLLGWSSGTEFTEADDATGLLAEWSQLGKPHFLPEAKFPRTCARLCLMWERILHEGYTSFWL